jgi:hypothetical protein
MVCIVYNTVRSAVQIFYCLMTAVKIVNTYVVGSTKCRVFDSKFSNIWQYSIRFEIKNHYSHSPSTNRRDIKKADLKKFYVTCIIFQVGRTSFAIKPVQCSALLKLSIRLLFDQLKIPSVKCRATFHIRILCLCHKDFLENFPAMTIQKSL